MGKREPGIWTYVCLLGSDRKAESVLQRTFGMRFIFEFWKAADDPAGSIVYLGGMPVFRVYDG